MNHFKKICDAFGTEIWGYLSNSVIPPLFGHPPSNQALYVIWKFSLQNVLLSIYNIESEDDQ